MRRIDRVLLGAGGLIPLWLFFGVLLTATGYPGYSHWDQAMSQLGAVGAPTHGYSPWVNNFPLALLFLSFAVGIARAYRHSRAALFSAALIALHGLGSLGTGSFSCDPGCAPAQPSFSQQMHNLSGLLMFLSLTLASALWVALARRLTGCRAFAGYSLACTLLALLTVGLMAHAASSGHDFGLYQRLNYGVSVLWVAGLAWVTWRRGGPCGLIAGMARSYEGDGLGFCLQPRRRMRASRWALASRAGGLMCGLSRSCRRRSASSSTPALSASSR
ncbi:MAG: hypothetical protein GAK45_00303 [Pseudomonas citronellolis]|nr:MAG: hypothetical protein GAK45_00303 [Pseudomonas citronellolis]